MRNSLCVTTLGGVLLAMVITRTEAVDAHAHAHDEGIAPVIMRVENALDFGATLQENANFEIQQVNPKRVYEVIDGERILMPLKLPKLSWRQKEALILATGNFNRTEIEARRNRRRQRVARKSSSKKRRAIAVQPPTRPHRTALQRSESMRSGPPIAVSPQFCPAKIDTVTQAHNHRTYAFTGEYVHQIYRDRLGLQQKSVFTIPEMFPKGPRQVSVALTNMRSAVTILIEYNTVYRFRWSKKNQKFYLARKSPQPLDRNVTFVPRFGFQWTDGNLILSDGSNFATYDAYWNVATFVGKMEDYFPAIPRDAIGVSYSAANTFLWLTPRGNVVVYDKKKFRIEQEYPVRINDYIACMSNPKHKS